MATDWADFDAKCKSGGNLKRFLAANGAKKIGKSMACPFHNDKSPSASYYLKGDVELFNCFTCGFGGDIFAIYRKVNGVTNKSELNKLVGDFCGVLLPTFLNANKKPTYKFVKKVEAPKYKFVKKVESAEIIEARKRAVEQYNALFKTPKGVAFGVDKTPEPLVDKPSENVELKPTIKTELKPTANVELKQNANVELKPTAKTKAVDLPPELKDLPPELKDLPRALTQKENVWRKRQYAPYFKHAKYHSFDLINIFISFEDAALNHCYGESADFKKRRADYKRVAEWRARRAYAIWLFYKNGDCK